MLTSHHTTPHLPSHHTNRSTSGGLRAPWSAPITPGWFLSNYERKQKPIFGKEATSSQSAGLPQAPLIRTKIVRLQNDPSFPVRPFCTISFGLMLIGHQVVNCHRQNFSGQKVCGCKIVLDFFFLRDSSFFMIGV